MSQADTRALTRSAVLLLVASVVRVAWSPEPGLPPPSGEDVLPALVASTRAKTAEAERRSLPLGDEERLDPNRAGEEDLDRLPGVGPATARAWVRTRTARGPFQRPADLMEIPGVGPALLAKVGPHLTWPPEPAGPSSGPRPRAATLQDRRGVLAGRGRVDVNRADTLALQELPGVGPALARRIVQARLRAPFRAVDDLLRVRGIGPSTLDRLRPLVSVGW